MEGHAGMDMDLAGGLLIAGAQSSLLRREHTRCFFQVLPQPVENPQAVERAGNDIVRISADHLLHHLPASAAVLWRCSPVFGFVCAILNGAHRTNGSA